MNSLLVCPWCGESYRRVIWKSGSIRYAVWRCGNRLEGGKLRCEKSVSLKETELQKSLYKAYTWKLKEKPDTLGAKNHFATDHPSKEAMAFEEFLDTGIITKIDVYSKNELHVLFQDGKMKVLNCSGKS